MPKESKTLILQLYARTPAPCRDYCGLSLKRDEIVLNIWNITYGPHVYPKRSKRTFEDFLEDAMFQGEVNRLFGEHVLSYAMAIARNERNLRNLPEKVFLRILRYLAMKDILNLSQTSKIMFELCNTDNTWKILFSKRFKKPPNLQDAVVAERFGWKDTLQQKINNTVKTNKNKTNKKCLPFAHSSSEKKQFQKNVRVMKDAIDKDLSGKVSVANLDGQVKERRNKIQNKSTINIIEKANTAKQSPIVIRTTNTGVRKNDQPTVKISDNRLNTARNNVGNIKSASSFALQKAPTGNKTSRPIVSTFKSTSNLVPPKPPRTPLTSRTVRGDSKISETNKTKFAAKSTSVLIAPKQSAGVINKNKINTAKSSSIVKLHSDGNTTRDPIGTHNINKKPTTARSSSVLIKPNAGIPPQIASIIRKVDKNEQLAKMTNNTINNVRSSSALVSPKTAALNNLQMNHTKSVGNVNQPFKKTLSTTKNCLNLNTKKVNNADIRIDIPRMSEHPRSATMQHLSKKQTFLKK